MEQLTVPRQQCHYHACDTEIRLTTLAEGGREKELRKLNRLVQQTYLTLMGEMRINEFNNTVATSF